MPVAAMFSSAGLYNTQVGGEPGCVSASLERTSAKQEKSQGESVERLS
jgi:hypothetical protein